MPNREKEMNILANTFAAITAGALLGTGALAQSAASLVVPTENEPAPQVVRRRSTAWPARQRRRLHPVPGGEFAHHARRRCGRAQRLSAGRTSSVVDPEGRVLSAHTVTFKSPGK